MKETLWGETRCPGARVKIYVNSDLKKEQGAVGMTHWQHGVCSISLHPSVFKSKRRLHEVLVHEFTHVVEYLNDASYFSVVTEDDCTDLAKTLEKQLAPLLFNLKKKKGRT